MKKPINEIERLKLIAGLINEIDYNEAVYSVKKKTLTEAETKEAKADEAVKAEVKAKAPSIKKPKILHIDVANPYEYRMGIQYELEEMDDYSNEALEKAKVTVLKNLAKDVNFYTTLLNQDQSSFKFEAPKTDKPGYQARPDGHLKKELKKDEKANVQDTLGKKEEGKKKPKGVSEFKDKGVEGKEKVVKENVEEALPGVNLGASFDKLKSEMGAEDQFNQLMSKYDWYYEMSDDPRTYDRGLALDKQLKALGKQIGADKAVALFNAKAPSDRKVTTTFFMEGEEKHAKLKETLKTALKKEILNPKDINQYKKTGEVVNIPDTDTSAITAAKNAKLNYRTYRP